MSSAKTPDDRNYGQEMRQTLEAQIDLAPELFRVESEYRPQYAQLDFDIASEMTPQMLDLYQNEIGPVLDEMALESQASQREADISAVEDLGPRAAAAFRNMDPDQKRLMQLLNDQAYDQLNAGTSLTAGQGREVEQAARAAQLSRGLGYGVGDAAQEAMAKGYAGEELMRRRQGFAQSMVGMNQATAVDPFQAILGRPGQNPMQAQAVLGQAGTYNPGQVFNPESAYAGSLYETNYNADAAAKIASANNKAALIGAGIKAVGSIGGGMMGGCWVAREVYGVADPRWLLFRAWLFNRPESLLFKTYMRYGERFAAFIRNKPVIKRAIRFFMDRAIR